MSIKHLERDFVTSLGVEGKKDMHVQTSIHSTDPSRAHKAF